MNIKYILDTEQKITILFTRRMSCYWRVLIPYFSLKIKRNPKTFSPPFVLVSLLIAFVHCPCSVCRANLSVIVLNMSVTCLFYRPVLQRVLYTNSSCYFFSTLAVHIYCERLNTAIPSEPSVWNAWIFLYSFFFFQYFFYLDVCRKRSIDACWWRNTKFAHFVAFPGSFEMAILRVFVYMYICVIKSLMRNREWCYAIFFIVK